MAPLPLSDSHHDSFGVVDTAFGILLTVGILSYVAFGVSGRWELGGGMMFLDLCALVVLIGGEWWVSKMGALLWGFIFCLRLSLKYRLFYRHGYYRKQY